jgi:hypothetical protein
VEDVDNEEAGVVDLLLGVCVGAVVVIDLGVTRLEGRSDHLSPAHLRRRPLPYEARPPPKQSHCLHELFCFVLLLDDCG